MAIYFDIEHPVEGKTTVFPNRAILDVQPMFTVCENRRITSQMLRDARDSNELLGYVCIGNNLRLDENLSQLNLMGFYMTSVARDVFDVKPEWVDTICELIESGALRVVHLLFVTDSEQAINEFISRGTLQPSSMQFMPIKRAIKSCKSIEQVVSRYMQ